MKKITVQVYSPDNIPIENVEGYSTDAEAESAFKRWKKNYEHQGYYSCNGHRIPLDELLDYCRIIRTVNKNNKE